MLSLYIEYKTQLLSKAGDFMPLTHVCIWETNNGFRRITAEDASLLYPYGVSARSGHFVCELCAQNVTFTAPGAKTRHFRHDPSNPNKECDERQKNFDSSYGRSLVGLNSHIMPLRINVSGSKYSFQIGFFSPPNPNARCDKIVITTYDGDSYEYLFERIEKGKTTFLDVGHEPSKNYRIEYLAATPEIKKYWSEKTPGIYTNGSFFDAKTGNLLLAGAKAYSGCDYYLLLKERVFTTIDIDAVELTQPYLKWHLYKIHVNRFSKEAARFFLRYAVFLTEKPTKYYPIWPPYIRDPYILYHNSYEFYFFMCGEDAVLNSYPAYANAVVTEDGKLYKLRTRDREQLVSVGCSGALGFTYLIRQSLNRKRTVPEISIIDASGNDLVKDKYTRLPKQNLISVISPYDGKAVIKKYGEIVYVYRLAAEQLLMIDHLSFDMEILFYQGQDCVRTICFERTKQSLSDVYRDDILLEKLKSCKGSAIPITHALGTVAKKLSSFPKTKQWLLRTINSGEISQSAYQLLFQVIRSNNNIGK